MLTPASRCYNKWCLTDEKKGPHPAFTRACAINEAPDAPPGECLSIQNSVEGRATAGERAYDPSGGTFLSL